MKLIIELIVISILAFYAYDYVIYDMAIVFAEIFAPIIQSDLGLNDMQFNQWVRQNRSVVLEKAQGYATIGYFILYFSIILIIINKNRKLKNKQLEEE